MRATPRAAGAIAALVFALAALFAATARGGPLDPKTLPLDFSAPPACIDGGSFRSRLLAMPTAPGSPQPPRAVSIVIEERAGFFTGHLVVIHADGTTTTRSVESVHCDEVTDALEFVVALALGLDHPAVRPIPSAAATTPTSPPAPPSTAPPPPPPPPEAPAHPARQETAEQSHGAAGNMLPSEPRASGWRFLAGARATVQSGLGPDVEVAPGLAVGFVFDRPRLFAPSVELSGAWTTSGTIATSSGNAKIMLAEGAALGCPLRVALGPAFALRPCVEVAAGALLGSGSGPHVLSGPTQTPPWVALTPLARAEWQLQTHVVVHADVGPAFEPLRDRFYFSPGSTVYRTPVVGVLGRAGVFFRWP